MDGMGKGLTDYLNIYNLYPFLDLEKKDIVHITPHIDLPLFPGGIPNKRVLLPSFIASGVSEIWKSRNRSRPQCLGIH